MDKTIENIIKYLDGQMSASEQNEFETELENSAELRNLFDQYKKLFNEIDKEKLKTVDQQYAINIIPEFRRRLETRSTKKTRFAFAYALTASIIILLIITFSLFNKDSKRNEDIIAADIPDTELDYLYNQMTAEELLGINEINSEEKFDSMYMQYYSTQLIEDGDQVENLFAINNLDFEEIENLLSEQELEIVYNKLINKDFF